MKVRNEEYWNSFQNFFIRLFRYFSEVPTAALPYDNKVSLSFDKEGNPYPAIEKIINFDKLVRDHLSDIISWPEYKELKNNVILIGPYGQKWEDPDNFNLHNNYIPNIFHELYDKSKKSFMLDCSILKRNTY